MQGVGSIQKKKRETDQHVSRGNKSVGGRRASDDLVNTGGKETYNDAGKASAWRRSRDNAKAEGGLRTDVAKAGGEETYNDAEKASDWRRIRENAKADGGFRTILRRQADESGKSAYVLKSS